MNAHVLDVFKGDAFTVTSLTAKVNKLPFVPGQIGQLGVFQESGVDTTTVVIEEMAGSLKLVAPTPRGGPGQTRANDKRKVRSFVIPHIQIDDAVMADEVQGVRVFGSPDQTQTVEYKVDEKLQRHARDLDATLEHLRVGAIKGLILDKTGATLYDLFSEFGIVAPTAVDFVLGTTTTDIRTKCYEVQTGIEDALDGDTYTGIDAICGKDFWRKLVTHPKVEATYQNWEAAAQLRQGIGAIRPFEFGDITWQRYRTGVKAAADNASGAKFIGDNEVRFVVKGVPDLFIQRNAPADYVETVNTIGLPRYSKQYPMANGKGVSLETQMNPLPLCTRPEVLYSGLSSN